MIGTDDKRTKPPAPPYLPYKTFRTFVDGLKQGMPTRIDKSLMRSYSGAAQSSLIGALFYLNLITDTGIPTDSLTRLVTSEGVERQRMLREVLEAGYPFLFANKAEFDIARATQNEFTDKFRRVQVTGDTIRKCQRFFLDAARDAELPVSRFITAQRVTAANPARKPRRARVPNGAREDRPAVDEQPVVEPPPPPPMGWEQMLLAKFPAFDPAWSPEVQSKWFDAFDRLMRTRADAHGSGG